MGFEAASYFGYANGEEAALVLRVQFSFVLPL